MTRRGLVVLLLLLAAWPLPTHAQEAERLEPVVVTATRAEPNPGGLSLGRTGPVTEGLVAWLGGLGFLVLIAMWLTARRRDKVIETENHS